jgi:hypothetical protein
MSGKGVWLGWDNVGGKSGRDLTFVQFKGEAFEVYGEETVLRVLRSLRPDIYRVVRVDVAFDGVPLNPEEWYLAWKSGECTGKRVDYLENNRGHAARVGVLSRGSSQASMYDERGLVRLEFRTRKRSLAGEIVDAWLDGGTKGIAGAGLAGLRGHLGKSWDKLDEWVGEGPALMGAPEPVEVKEITQEQAITAAGVLVMFGMRYEGARSIAETLAEAAKGLSAKKLDEFGIDWRDVGAEFGRKGPEGYNGRVGEVRDLLAKQLSDVGELL